MEPEKTDYVKKREYKASSIAIPMHMAHAHNPCSGMRMHSDAFYKSKDIRPDIFRKAAINRGEKLLKKLDIVKRFKANYRITPLAKEYLKYDFKISPDLIARRAVVYALERRINPKDKKSLEELEKQMEKFGIESTLELKHEKSYRDNDGLDGNGKE